MTNETATSTGQPFRDPEPSLVTIDSTMSEIDSRRWARHKLGIDDTQALTAADTLRRVMEWEYVLPPEAVDAMQLLANPDGIKPESRVVELATRWGGERRREQAVTDFAQTFFDLAPEERTRRWQTLRDECRDDPRSTRWLNDLAPGLDVVVPVSSTEERFVRLVAECCQSFVMRLPGRARRRQAFVIECRADREEWEIAASTLQKLHPLFVEPVAKWVTKLRRDADGSQGKMTRFEAKRRIVNSVGKWPFKSSLPYDEPEPDLVKEVRLIPVRWIVFAFVFARILVALVNWLATRSAPAPPVSPPQRQARPITPVMTPPPVPRPAEPLPEQQPPLPQSRPSSPLIKKSPPTIEQFLKQNPEIERRIRDALRKKANAEQTPSPDPCLPIPAPVSSNHSLQP